MHVPVQKILCLQTEAFPSLRWTARAEEALSPGSPGFPEILQRGEAKATCSGPWGSRLICSHPSFLGLVIMNGAYLGKPFEPSTLIVVVCQMGTEITSLQGSIFFFFLQLHLQHMSWGLNPSCRGGLHHNPSNAASLTYRARPGIEPTSLQR